jgi:hypothetical protein
MNTARTILAGAGTQTATLAFGGSTSVSLPGVTGSTESWNGSSWTSSPNSLNTARYSLGWIRYSNSSFSFWWDLQQLLQQQQNLIMVLGQMSLQ